VKHSPTTTGCHDKNQYGESISVPFCWLLRSGEEAHLPTTTACDHSKEGQWVSSGRHEFCCCCECFFLSFLGNPTRVKHKTTVLCAISKVGCKNEGALATYRRGRVEEESG